MPLIFDVILANSDKARAIVSSKEIDNAPSWLLLDDKGKPRKNVSYYEVAGWASVEKRHYDLLDRMIMWLIRHWPGR